MSKDGMLGSLMRVLVTVPEDRLGVVLDLSRKLTGKDCEVLTTQIKRILRGELRLIEKPTPLILRLRSGGRILTIPACGGEIALSRAGGIFGRNIDQDFVLWGLDRKGAATGETSVRVYELNIDADFKTMFRSISPDLRRLYFTQNQIVAFAANFEDWLGANRSSRCFFLFQEEKVPYVACIFGNPMAVRVYRLGHFNEWSAASQVRVVVPSPNF